MMRYLLRVTIITITVAMIAVGFSSLTASANPENPEIIKIGYTAPFTGPAAEFGTNGWRGVQLALEDINKKGIVINGKLHKIDIIRYDSRCEPTEAVANFRKLVMQEKVVAILGDHCSSCCMGIAPLCDKFKIPGITVECMADDITSPGHPFYFRIYIPSGLVAIWGAPVFAKRLNLKTAAFLCKNDDYGRSFSEGLSDELLKLGVKTLTKEYFELGTTDFMVYLLKIKKANPDALFFVGLTPEGAMVLKQAREIGLIPSSVKFVGSVEMSEKEITTLVGPEVLEGTYAWAVWGEVPAELAKKVQNKFNAPMHYGIVYGYDCLQVIAKAIESAQSLDPIKIRDAMKNVDFQGFSGHVKFEAFDAPNGRHYENQCRVPPLLIQWRNGQRKVVEE